MATPLPVESPRRSSTLELSLSPSRRLGKILRLIKLLLLGMIGKFSIYIILVFYPDFLKPGKVIQKN